jgi:hypothetical protein
MEETAYIEKLKSLYPAEGQEASNQTLMLADEAVRAFPESREVMVHAWRSHPAWC